jgi:hypothetical protein
VDVYTQAVLGLVATFVVAAVVSVIIAWLYLRE